jgi:hypothetical protein
MSEKIGIFGDSSRGIYGVYLVLDDGFVLSTYPAVPGFSKF